MFDFCILVDIGKIDDVGGGRLRTWPFLGGSRTFSRDTYTARAVVDHV
jgi:hypothetical protein